VADVSLSVIMPVFNEAPHLASTIDALVEALENSGFEPELIVVDDGSTDGSAGIAEAAVAGRAPLRLLSQTNRGRFEARREGLTAARGDVVLLLDARVRLLPDALRFARERLESGEPVWNGHVRIETDSALGTFWRLLAELAWREYFDDPRTTNFGVAEFDRFPKGTTCFLAPRQLLVDAVEQFRTRYTDVRLANDDTPVLRNVAERQRIGISPRFACIYAPRTGLGRFLRHSFHRGIVFVDGHGSASSRFFPAVLAFFPVSAVVMAVALRRPLVLPAAAAACGLAAGAYGVRAGRSRREVGTLLTVTPLYALGHGLGMWRGLAEVVRGRLGK
jgi:glycosyltransferase involved in cell wall biosynthesis